MTERYQSVNGAWPEGTNDGRNIAPTPQEAISAAKRLYRLIMKRPFRGTVKLTSGRRHTSIRRRVFYVNPNQTDWRGSSGWHALVHGLSHHCHRALYPRHKPHDQTGMHAHIEREMIRHVVDSGWLDGKLKRPEKPIKQTDVRAERRQRVLDRIAAWEAKRKRAERALAKLKRQARYYDRAIAA